MLPINANYRAKTDNYSVILQQLKHRKGRDGVEYDAWQTVSNHRTYNDAVKAVVNKKIKVCKSTLEIIAAIEELHKMIDGLVLKDN